MRAFAALFAFELRRQRAILAISPLLGLLSAAVPSFPGVHARDPHELRAVAATTAAILFSGILAVTFGSSALVRDLAENRLSFFLSRPIRVVSFWCARLGAAIAIAAASAALTIVPAALVGADFRGKSGVLRLLGDYFNLVSNLPPPWRSSSLAIGFVIAGCGLALFFASNAVNLAARTKAAWGALDLVSACSAGVAIAVAWVDLRRFGAPLGAAKLLLFSSSAAFAVLAGATFVQVLVGRSDRERAHRAYSLAAGAGLFAVAATALAASAGFERPRLTDIVGLRHDMGARSISERWSEVGGSARGGELRALFLVDNPSGRWVRSRVVSRGFGRPLAPSQYRFTRDSKLFELGGYGEPGVVSLGWRDLSRNPGEARSTPIGFSSWPTSWAISPDGHRLAALLAEKGESRIDLFDTTAGKRLATVFVRDRVESLAVDGGSVVYFTRSDVHPSDPQLAPVDDTWRSWIPRRATPEPHASAAGSPDSPPAVELREQRLTRWSLQTDGSTVAVASTPPIRPWVSSLSTASGDRVLLVNASGPSLLLDGAWLAPLDRIPNLAPNPYWERRARARFLDDGGIVLETAEGNRSHLSLWRAPAVPLSTFDLPAGEYAFVIAGTTSIRAWFLHQPRMSSHNSWTLESFDWSTGAREVLATGLQLKFMNAQPELLISPIFLDREGEAVKIDLASNRLRPFP